MVGGIHPVWARAVALGVLAAWLPCIPLGLCMAASAKASAKKASHGCSRQSPVKMSNSPQKCRLESPTPTPPGPPPTVLAAPTVTTAHTQTAADTGALHRSRPTPFSPLAIVLRI